MKCETEKVKVVKVKLPTLYGLADASKGGIKVSSDLRASWKDLWARFFVMQAGLLALKKRQDAKRKARRAKR
jgi:hypothetical protein